MLKLRTQNFSNVWFANGRELENIAIYDATGILLDTKRRWLETGMSSNSQEGFPGVTDIAARMKVKFDRLEHFSCKGTLYIHAALFSGYSTVATDTQLTCDDAQVCDRKYIELCLGDTWLKVTEQYWDNYRNTELGDRAEAVMAIFNKDIPDHSSRHLSQAAAARLIKCLPAINKAAGL